MKLHITTLAILASISACSSGGGSNDDIPVIDPPTPPTTPPVTPPYVPTNPNPVPPVVVPPVTPTPVPVPPVTPIPPVPPVATIDFFGSLLEEDTETPMGIPTQPKNLRVDLISNDWAELNWAPSNGDVALYRMYRSDGRFVDIVPPPESSDGINGGLYTEIKKYWNTTSYIDCNYTRFADCDVNGPNPGDTFTYNVSAIDSNGNESSLSNGVTVTYHTIGDAVAPYSDPYLDDNGFAQNNDLSTTGFLSDFALTFSDEFDGDSIDASKWNTSLTWGDEVFINEEQQYFVDTQKDPDFGYNPFVVADSTLTITAIKTPWTDQLPAACANRCQYLSGALSSHDKFDFLYGYAESRMKVSGQSGALSTFYLYHRYPGEGIHKHAPEIDIIEYLGENPFGDEMAFQTYHYQTPNYDQIMSAPTMSYSNPTGALYSDEFHTYGVLWEPSLVIWYIDGKEVKRLTGRQVSRQPMSLVNYLVTGSGWAPTPTDESITFDIDYIKVYQRPAYAK